MSVPAARIRTTSGWRDIAIQGAQGPPGPMRELAALTFGTVASAAPPGTLVADFGSIAFDGEPVIVEVGVGFVDLKSSTNSTLILYDFITGADVQVSRIAYWRGNGAGDAGGLWHPQTISFRWTPSAGNHRFRLRLQLDTGAALTLNQLELPNYARIVKAAAGGGLPIGAPLYVTPAQFATLVPTNGMEVYLIADAANGVIWHLRYNVGSSSAYKWEFVGGAPLTATIPNYDSITATAFAPAPTDGPKITLPLAGDYIAHFDADLRPPTNVFAGVGVAWPGSGPTNDEAIWAASATGGYGTSTNAKMIRRNGVVAGNVTMHYFSQAGSALVGRRWLSITPVRVG